MRFANTSSQLTRTVLIGALATSSWLYGHKAPAADEKQVCLGAYISAQRLRNEDKLLEAREQLLVCARDVCPPTLKKDCTTWTGEVDQATPSVVIEARNAEGGDVIDVKVTVDGKTFTDRIDGKARPINPGVHTVKYEMEGAPAVEDKVVIRAGEKMRKLTVKFTTKSKPGGGPATSDSAGGGSSPSPNPSAAPTTSSDKEEGARPVPTGVYVLGAVGLVALGGFAYFAAKFNGQVADLDECKPRCPPSQVDDASSTRTISYIPLAIGVASLGAATIWYLARPTAETSKEGHGPRFDFTQVAGGGVATFKTSF